MRNSGEIDGDRKQETRMSWSLLTALVTIGIVLIFIAWWCINSFPKSARF